MARNTVKREIIVEKLNKAGRELEDIISYDYIHIKSCNY